MIVFLDGWRIVRVSNSGDVKSGCGCRMGNLRQASATRAASTLRSWVSRIFARSYAEWELSVMVFVRFEHGAKRRSRDGGSSTMGIENKIRNAKKNKFRDFDYHGDLQAALDDKIKT